MSQLPNFRRWIALLLVGGAILPITICLLLGVSALLSAMGDMAGSSVLNRISLALAIIWLLDLIVLILFQGLNSLFGISKNTDDSDRS